MTRMMYAKCSRIARLRPWAALVLVLSTLPAFAHPDPAGRKLPLWRVTDTAGHVLYLVGSMHALRHTDYPLPTAMRNAFHVSDRLVEELDLSNISPRKAANQALSLGMLPQGTLATAMGTQWEQAQRLAAAARIDLGQYAKVKPWLAAVDITDVLLIRAGYRPQLGLDMHFARRAAARGMPIEGLETLKQQLRLLNGMSSALQRRFLIQTLQQAPDAATQLAALHRAWKNGNAATLLAIERRDFRGFEGLRRRLLANRNRRWLPHLTECLSSGTTCFVAVGVEHMVGPDGLVALLRKTGDKVVQLRASGME